MEFTRPMGPSTVSALDCFLLNYGPRPVFDVRGFSTSTFTKTEEQTKPDDSGAIFFSVPSLAGNGSFHFRFVNYSDMYANFTIPKTVSIRSATDSRINLDVPLNFHEMLPLGVGAASGEVTLEPLQWVGLRKRTKGVDK